MSCMPTSMSFSVEDWNSFFNFFIVMASLVAGNLKCKIGVNLSFYIIFAFISLEEPADEMDFIALLIVTEY